METRPVVPDQKHLARLVFIREEAQDMMGGGILDERNNCELYTLLEPERLAEDNNSAIAAAALKAIYELKKQWEIEEGDSWRFMMDESIMEEKEGTNLRVKKIRDENIYIWKQDIDHCGNLEKLFAR
ncbi:hypothetical protein PIB30_030452 [Stylosanthes scabra]|uniref:Uncharacterized protein n=1 Tax=Stylosanthes scabra TaxID=79078 RepID=A0ABU6SBV4_9FABA|nr:hypothetical protein [Stylosanthes scabra]